MPSIVAHDKTEKSGTTESDSRNQEHYGLKLATSAILYATPLGLNTNEHEN